MKKNLLRGNMREMSMLIALIIIIVLFSILTNGTLLRPMNIANLINQNAYVVILACGMLLCILTGGNQQKVLLAKALFAEPDILMLDEPTRGVDVGAKYEIYEIINKMVSDGKSVLMVSSELPELLGMADRIYVMNEGHVVAELQNDGSVTQEEIMGYILRDSNKDITGIQNDTEGVKEA